MSLIQTADASLRSCLLLVYSVSGQNKERKVFNVLPSLFSDRFWVTCTVLWSFTCRKFSTGNKILTVLKNSSVLCLVAQLCPTLCDPMGCSPPGSSVHGILRARILEWVAMPSSMGSSQPRNQNLGLLHCRWILYCLSHEGSPRTLVWVTYPFSSKSSWPRNWTGVSCIAGDR